MTLDVAKKTEAAADDTFKILPDGGKRLGLLIEPLDVLFCRDGRPFGESTMALGGLPSPQVIAGALRSHALRKLDALPTGGGSAKWFRDLENKEKGWVLGMPVRGPWLCKLNGDAVKDVYIPTPADVVCAKENPKTLFRTTVRKNAPPGWGRQGPQKGLLPLWHDGDEEIAPVGEYLDREGLAAYLAGGTPAAITAAKTLFDLEFRTGIKIDPNQLTAAESQIYGVRMVRLRRGIAFYAELDLLSGAPLASLNDVFPVGGWVIRLGGEGKMARVRRLEPLKWGAAAGAAAGDGGDLFVLTAPAPFDAHGWKPDFRKMGRKLIAAAVPGYTSISGWDFARNCPKPTRHFVPAGAVYFLEGSTGKPLETLCQGKDVQCGYGSCLKGTWNYG